MSRFALIKALLGPIMRLMFRPRVEGVENIPGDGPVILAGNHLTFIDSMILPLVLRPAGRSSSARTSTSPARASRAA